MFITLIGAGCGAETLTREAVSALSDAQLVIGAKRLLRGLSDCIPPACARCEAVTSDAIVRAVAESDCARVCVLLSGDTGFYSGARRLLPLLEGHEVRVLPGVSSLQLLAARLGKPWQDWLLCSAHGKELDVLSAVCSGRPVFLLTSGSDAPQEICRTLTEAGLGDLTVTVGQSLGTAEEQLVTAPAAALTEEPFSSLNVMLIEAAPNIAPRSHGFPDEAFLRAEGVPMTKQLVRAAALALLGVTPEDVCWDIGAGTGSVSIELARLAKGVWAVERDEAALRIAEENRRRFGAWNLRLVAGAAPDALKELPKPDKVFVGGTGGALRETLRAVFAANEHARVCVTAITLETLQAAVSELEALGRETEITQLAVTRSRKAGQSHMMLAQNPVWLITGVAP